MAERQLTLPGPIVKKSNVLARASWAVKSVYELRLVALVASRVHKGDEDFQDYEIPIRELIEHSDNGGKTYKDISRAVESLMSRVIDLPSDNPKVFRRCNVFSYCEYNGQSGIIKCRFDKSLKPHYLNLKGQFTEWGLLEYLLLPSIYSKMIFELLKSWDDKPSFEISLSELFEFLHVPESMRRYPDFKRYVLNQAHKDINKKTSLNYEWEPIKKGRSVFAIRFIFFGAKKSIVAKENKAISDQKQSQNNNKNFKAAVACHQLGKCDYKPTSKVCTICKKLFPTE